MENSTWETFRRELDTKRGAAANAHYLFYGLLAAIGFGSYIYLTQNGRSSNDQTGALVCAGVAVVVLMVARVWATRQYASLRDYFRAWRRDVVQGLDGSAVYHDDMVLSEDAWTRSGLCSQTYNGYMGGHYMQRKVGATLVEGSNLTVTYTYQEQVAVSHTDANGRSYTTIETRTHTIVVFSGIFLRFDSNKHFNGWVLLHPKNTPIRKGAERVATGNADMERIFTVQASDLQTAFYLLTPDMQQRLLAFAGEYKCTPWISFTNESIYVAIPNVQFNYGGAPFLYRPVKMSFIESVAALIRSNIAYYASAVDKLNLNTRIWTKT